MKKIINVIMVAAFLVALNINVRAQVVSTGGGSGSSSINVSDPGVPTVPVEVALKGRLAVVQYLLPQMDHVTVGYAGGSIVQATAPSYYLDSNYLKSLGYVHPGQFVELTNALAGIQFETDVVETPNGQYDVSCNVSLYSADNAMLLSGSGYLYIAENIDGTLSTGNFNPWVMINNDIILATTNAQAAKWLGPNGEDNALNMVYDQNGMAIGVDVPVSDLERGLIVVSDYSGHLTGWNLKDGTMVTGKKVLALLGQVQSSDVRPLVNPSKIDAGNSQFYVDGGQIYGRFPLLDLVTTNGLKESFNFTVPVWGQQTGVEPSHIYVTPIYFSGNNGPTSLQIGVEQELLHVYFIGGGAETDVFQIGIPPGGYHVRATFDGVLDWDADTSGKG